MTTPHTSGAADLPEALRLADLLDLYATGDEHQRTTERAAVELRRLHALAAGQAVALAVDDKTAGHAMLWRQHCDKLDALVTYCPTCCQGFIAQKEMTRDQIIYECGKTAGRATRPAPPAMDGGAQQVEGGDAVDAARWREALMHVGAAHHFGGQHFTLNTLPAPGGSVGANMLKGGVAQHFTKAIDAERAARAAQKEGEKP